MHMMVKKRHCKLVALFLLLVFLVPFVPVASVSADPLPVQVPDFPYGVNVYHSTNTGSFALWQVHGSNYVSYVQTYSNVFGDGLAFPVVLRSGLDWTGYYYYINYEKIIDTWDIYGNHIDGFPSTQNIRIPRPNETTTDSDVYATLVYCTTDIYCGNGYGDDDVYAYQNFIVPSYADPTPTPVPQPVIRGWFDYPELPSNFSDSTMCILRTHSDGVNDGQLIGIAFSSNSAAFIYPNFYKDRSPYNYRSQASINYAITVNTWLRYAWHFSVFTVNYDESTDSYSVGYNLNSFNQAPADNVWFTSNKLDWNGETLCCWSLIPNNDLVVTGSQAGIYANSPQSWFEILFTNHNKTPGTSDNPNVSPTATPSPRPTAIPQPSTSPTPTDPPETGDDNNYTGLFGWLKRIRDAILNIPKKIVSGILDALKYIFIPDGNKVKEVYNTLNNKFGIQHPAKFTFNSDELFRPNNVIWKFHPISLNGEETETVDITLIDFEKVDEWLDSSPGMVITRILQAMFGITMFAYLIYIFTKHIATINYTDAKTIKDLDTSSQKGGNDND